jgi:hypothetical protein
MGLLRRAGMSVVILRLTNKPHEPLLPSPRSAISGLGLWRLARSALMCPFGGIGSRGTRPLNIKNH